MCAASTARCSSFGPSTASCSPARAPREIVAAFPSATLVELPGSGHMVNWENPSGVADLSLAFLA